MEKAFFGYESCLPRGTESQSTLVKIEYGDIVADTSSKSTQQSVLQVRRELPGEGWNDQNEQKQTTITWQGRHLTVGN